MSEVEERRIIERCRSGDMAAWRELVEEHHDALVAIAYRVLLHADEAQDTVQDAWIRIVRGIARFDGRSSFRTWATGIVIRMACTHARSLRSSLPLEELSPQMSMAGAGMNAVETRLDLKQALSALSPEIRAVVVLHYGEGYTFSEIGGILGIPQRTAANRAYKGMKDLRKHVEYLSFGKLKDEM